MSRPDTDAERLEAILNDMANDWTPRDRIMAAVLPAIITRHGSRTDSEITRMIIETAYFWADAALEYRNKK